MLTATTDGELPGTSFHSNGYTNGNVMSPHDDTEEQEFEADEVDDLLVKSGGVRKRVAPSRKVT